MNFLLASDGRQVREKSAPFLEAVELSEHCRGAESREPRALSFRHAFVALERNVVLSGLAPQETVVADVFDFLDSARRRWDLVIVDPPSFAPSERARPAALQAYRRLARAALAVVEPTGRFALASCSSHVTEADLLDVVTGIGPLRLRLSAGAASDHPVVPAFPDGRYLKFLMFDLA